MAKEKIENQVDSPEVDPKEAEKATEAARNRPNQGADKGKAVAAAWIKKSGGESGTAGLRHNVTWLTTEEFEALEDPVQQDFYDERESHKTSPIAEEEIVIEPDQEYLNLTIGSSLNIRDLGNGAFAEADGTNKEILKNKLQIADSSRNKVVLFLAGDLLGKEWELKFLNNAKVIMKKNGKQAALFAGLDERKTVLKRYIRYVRRNFPNVDIYLMNGAQEARINKYFKKNVLKEVVEELNDPHVKFIPGVNTMVVVERKREGAKSFYSTLGFLTNNGLSKANKGQTVLNAIKLNSGENLATVKFATNTNVSGKKGPNLYCVPGWSEFEESYDKKMPKIRAQGNDTFCLDVVGDDEIDVLQGPNFPEIEEPLEYIIHEEEVWNEELQNVLIERYKAEVQKKYSLPQTDAVRSINMEKKLTQEQKEQLRAGIRAVKQINERTMGGERNGNDMSKV